MTAKPIAPSDRTIAMMIAELPPEYHGVLLVPRLQAEVELLRAVVQELVDAMYNNCFIPCYTPEAPTCRCETYQRVLEVTK